MLQLSKWKFIEKNTGTISFSLFPPSLNCLKKRSFKHSYSITDTWSYASSMIFFKPGNLFTCFVSLG